MPTQLTDQDNARTQEDIGPDRADTAGHATASGESGARNSFAGEDKADDRDEKSENETTANSPAGTPRRSNRGFAAMAPEERRAIASRGGQSQGKQNNPGNFANNRERAREAGRKGGQH